MKMKEVMEYNNRRKEQRRESKENKGSRKGDGRKQISRNNGPTEKKWKIEEGNPSQ